jgi:hypothetical protein
MACTRPTLTALTLLALGGCEAAAPADDDAGPAYVDFSHPARVTILGYADETMEPALSPDGHTLVFNNSNDPSVDTNLHWAERIDDVTFQYGGPVAGADSTALDGVPSLDAAGQLYFISTRSYAQTASTIYRGDYQAGAIDAAELVAGLAASGPGQLIFDACVSPDGTSLYFAEGDYGTGKLTTAQLELATRNGSGFERAPGGAALLAAVNLPGGTQYAPAISASGLELYFTRLDGPTSPAIYRSTRASLEVSFGPPAKISEITGFAEAPTLSPDGNSLYYHRLEGGHFVLYRVTRP